MARKLKESAAWRVIAERLLTPGYEMRYGLCSEAGKLSDEGLLASVAEDAMLHRVFSHKEAYYRSSGTGRYSAYVYPSGADHEARAYAALWMAHEAESEGR